MEMNHLESQYWDIKNAIANDAQDINLVSLLGLKPEVYNDKWVIRWGSGSGWIIGMGDTVALAVRDFNNAYFHQKANNTDSSTQEG